jgi:hypothetical protein
MRILLLTIFLIYIKQICYAQTDYNKLLKKGISEIENNYAGFQDKIRGKEYIYDSFKTNLLSRNINNRTVLDSLFESYINFFNDDHLIFWNEKKGAEYKAKNIDTAPYFKIIDSTTYLKIPSFDISYKQDIDSLITENFKLITEYENLIIDLSGNGGGQDPTFRSLIQFLYTNPIYIQNLNFYVTEKNKTSRIDSIVQSQNMGKFVPLFGEATFIEVFENTTPLINPKNIAIIIDEYVGSSAEQFLLYAKQSRKVKLFGNNTLGAIDYSNLRTVWLIDEKLAFTIPMTKSQRLPNNPIDETGIQPDFYIQSENETAIYEIIGYLKKWK